MRFTRDFFIPKSPSKIIERPELNAQVFLVDNPFLFGLGFSGKRAKPDFHYKFKTDDERNKFIDRYFENLQANVNRKKEYAAGRINSAKRFLESLKPGTILYDTWGYEQTNVEFYRVLERKGSKVLIQELACKPLEATGWASDRVIPGEQTTDAPIWKYVRGASVKISDCISLRIYEPREGGLHRSWYG